MKIHSRDKVNDNGIENSNLLDYEYFLIHKNDVESDNYNTRRKKALVKLIFFVIENELTDIQRSVVILRKVKGLKNKEVAEMLNLDPSTTSRDLKTAQKKFDRAYKHYECIKRYMYE